MQKSGEAFQDRLKTEVIEPSMFIFEDKDFCRATGSETCLIDTDQMIDQIYLLPI